LPINSTLFDSLFSLEGKTALVTGASSGLGAHFAQTLHRAGARVALAARRTDRLESFAGRLRRDGGDAFPVAMDVADGESIEGAVRCVETEFGAIDIVVNNAGIPARGLFTEIEEAQWDQVLDTNLKGVWLVSKTVAARMFERGSGGIVNVASILGSGVLKGVSPYAASKAAVIQLTKAMALEAARHGVRVNAIAPGYVRTELNAGFCDSEAGQRLVKGIPMRRWGEVEDLDAALLMLCGAGARFITGTVVTVDGGHLLSIN
jgi:NAD(P)-dependent dehydrogenase (short-subunit alcohol dehydrogenase family)